MLTLNRSGEVADYPSVSQFEFGQSAYECGYFTDALQGAAGRPGVGPLHDAGWVDQVADAYYAAYDGANTAANKNGMSLFQQWYMLDEMIKSGVPVAVRGYRWLGMNPDKDVIRAWVTNVGTPVMITVTEQSVYDIGLGDKVPYGWKPSGSHIITVTGVRNDGNFVVRDTANVDASGVRPQPRVYDAGKLSISSATAVLLSWIPAIPQNYDPRTDASVYPTEHEYTVQAGDSLSEIASQHGLSLAALLSQNEATLNQAAREHGYSSCQDGRLIFPETVLHWS
jgi:hypothetical protein